MANFQDSLGLRQISYSWEPNATPSGLPDAEMAINLSDVKLWVGANGSLVQLFPSAPPANGVFETIDVSSGKLIVNSSGVFVNGVLAVDQSYVSTAVGVSYSNAVAQATILAGAAYANAVAQSNGTAGAAYSNAVTYADSKAATAFSNAVANAMANAIARDTVAYNNAVSTAATDASNKAATAFSNAVTNAVANAVAQATTLAATAFSNAVTNSVANAVAQATTLAATAFSNAVANAMANAIARDTVAYNNAISTAATDATTKAGTAYSNAIATASTDASNKAATAFSNAVANSAADATTKAATAFSNAVSTAATDATSKAGTAYSNAVSTAALDATTKAGTAFSNAVATASTDASTKAGTAYSNAIATAATDASNKAATAFSNAVANAMANAIARDAIAYANAVANSASYTDTKSATAFSNAVATSATDATTKAGTAYSNAIATAATDASSKAATAFSNAVTNAVANAVGQATTLAATAFSNAVTNAVSNAVGQATTLAATAYSNAVTNAVSNAVGQATTLAGTAYSNAVATAATDASNKAAIAFSNAVANAMANAIARDTTTYANAVSYADTKSATAFSNAVTNAVANAVAQATTLAATAFSNAVTNAVANAVAQAATRDNTTYANAVANSASYTDTKAATAFSNAVANSAADATTKAATAFSNAVATASTDASNKAATAFSNAVTNAVANAVGQATTLAGTAYSNAVANAVALATAAYSNGTTYTTNAITNFANIGLAGTTWTTDQTELSVSMFGALNQNTWVPFALGKSLNVSNNYTVIVRVPQHTPDIYSALDGVAKWRISTGGIVQIQLVQNTYSLSNTIIINHPFGSMMSIRGQTANPSYTLSSIASIVSNGVKDHDLTLTLTNASDIEVGHYLAILPTAGTGDWVGLGGYWAVTAVSGNDVTVKVTDRRASLDPTSTFTTVTIWRNTVVFKWDGLTSGSGLLVRSRLGSNAHGSFNNLGLVGNSQLNSSGIIMEDGCGLYCATRTLSLANWGVHGISTTRGGVLQGSSIIASGCGSTCFNIYQSSASLWTCLATGGGTTGFYVGEGSIVDGSSSMTGGLTTGWSIKQGKAIGASSKNNGLNNGVYAYLGADANFDNSEVTNSANGYQARWGARIYVGNVNSMNTSGTTNPFIPPANNLNTGGAAIITDTSGNTVNVMDLSSSNSLTVGGNATFQAPVLITGAAGTNRYIAGRTGSTHRWVMFMANPTAESGSDVGSDWQLSSYTDAGSGKATVMVARRSNSQVEFIANVVVGQSVTVNNSLYVNGSILQTGNATAATPIVMTGPSATNRYIQSRTSSNARWSIIMGDTTAESGSDSGSNFQIVSYTDAGVGKTTSINILRANSQVNFGGTIVSPTVNANNLTANYATVALQLNSLTTYVNGVLFVGNNTQNTAIIVNGPAATNRYLQSRTAGVARWAVVMGDTTAETGTNQGSNFSLLRYDDSGASLGNALTIRRDNGASVFQNTVVGTQFTADYHSRGSGGLLLASVANNSVLYSGDETNFALLSSNTGNTNVYGDVVTIQNKTGGSVRVSANSTAVESFVPVLLPASAPTDSRHATSKSYVDGIIAAADAMVYKGTINAAGSPNYPAADAGWTYKVSVAGRVGGASGKIVEAGDMIICTTDGTAAGTEASVGANWNAIQTNITFTPVQQGGGTGQSTNKVYIGWKSSTLGLTVDSTDLGDFVLANNSQTIINKTISGANNTLSNIAQSSVTNLTTDLANRLQLNLEDQTISGGARVTFKDLGTVSSGTLAIDSGDRPLQKYVNNGAHTVTFANDGASTILIVNGASAGAITWSGFTSVAGDPLVTTNGAMFLVYMTSFTGVLRTAVVTRVS